MVEEELMALIEMTLQTLDDLLRLLLINEECENPKVVVDGGELTRNINQKKNSGVLQACRCLFCDKCYRREYFFNKNVEYCESVW